jgi:hypothetical protein
MRAIAAAVLVIAATAACRGSAPGPAVAVAVAAPRRDLCAGLDDEACMERSLMRDMCRLDPDGDGCEALRAEGMLPPPAPPLDDLMGCWAVQDARDDQPTAWMCLGGSDVAIDGIGGWDVWPHGGWKRHDSERRAGWVAERADAPSLWLTVVQAETPPRPGDVQVAADGTKWYAIDRPARAADDRTVLHIADGSGALSATLVAGDEASERGARRAALPAPSAVCAAARACLGVVSRPPAPPPVPTGMEPEGEEVRDPLAGVVTLRGCYAAWSDASERLYDEVERADIPAACAIVTVGEHAWNGWRLPLRPPFAPIDSADEW